MWERPCECHPRSAYALVLELEVYKGGLREETGCPDTEGYESKHLIARCGKHQIGGSMMVHTSDVCQKLPYDLEHLLPEGEHPDTL